MKKFLMGIFIGLVALFGITSTTSGTQYFLENTQVKKQFNNSVETWENTNIIELTTPRENSYQIYEDFAIDDTNANENLEIYLTTTELYNQNKYILKTLRLSEYYTNIGLTKDEEQTSFVIYEPDEEYYYQADFNFNLNKWILVDLNLEVNLIIFNYNVDFEVITGQQGTQGFYELGMIGLNVQNVVIPTIEYDPNEVPEEPIPEPTPDSMESSIGNVIRGIIDWFVDIFNGLADAFVIVDSSGQFIGFTIWGQVLFIEVGIGLVILVLKWVIGLIRGV